MTQTWSKKFKQYLFLLNDGFFVLPYLSNSPETVYRSVTSLGAASHNTAQNSVRSNTIFCNGVLRYRELDSGFWLLGTDIEVKENILAKAIYDSSPTQKYYFLSFSVFKYLFPLPGDPQNALDSICWTFYKPETTVATYFYKGTRGSFYNIAFTREWALQHLSLESAAKTAELFRFLDSATGFLTWLDIVPNALSSAQKFQSLLHSQRTAASDLLLRTEVHALVVDFFNSERCSSRISTYKELKNPNYAIAARAEKIILQRLSLPFTGVEEIASEVNVSPTKLKVLFKAVFGISMLQYHKEKNMLLARQLLQTGEIPVKNVAALTGYDCGSKFAAAFKNRFGTLPSQFFAASQTK